MTRAEKLQAEQARAALQATWKPRLETLANRKKDPLKEAEFCERYGIEKTYFNRLKNCVVIGKDEKINPIEAAFVKEGV